jgi:hypothetical protein
MKRDAFNKRGYPGLALLWLHILTDFLFSIAELVTKKAGDFLKWRLRLQWVIACTLGFAIARCIALLIGQQFGVFQLAIFAASIGAMQAWVLAGRCFRKKEWVLYGIAGTIVAAVALKPLLLVAAPGQLQLVREVSAWLRFEPLRTLADRFIFLAPVWTIYGAFTGILQAAAIRSDRVSRYQWMRACALGYFLSALAGGFVIPYPHPFDSLLSLVLNNAVAGTVLGLVTSGPLERVLFNVQSDPGE